MSKLIEIETDQGTTYLSTSQIDVEYNGNTYQGGYVSTVSKVEQAGSVESGKLTVRFSGVDQSVISLFENESWRNRPCKILSCDISDNWAVSNVKDYYQSDMVAVDYSLGRKTSTVNLTCKGLYGSINQANAPDLGIIYAQYISDDVTQYFGKASGTQTRRSGKPGHRPPILD